MRSSAALALSVLLGCTTSDPGDAHVGYVEAEWTYVAAPTSGWLVESTSREGDVVAVGDVLFRLDDTQQRIAVDETIGRLEQTRAESRNVAVGARPAEIRALEAELAEARARLIEARSERDRVLPLIARGVEPTSRGEKVEANFKAAAARVEAIRQQIRVARLPAREAVREAATAAEGSAAAAVATARWRLDERTVKARVAGRIEERFHYPGEFVVAGSPVLAVLPADGIKIRFFVAEPELASLSTGKTVSVRADGVDAAIEATISFISSEAELTPPVIFSKESRRKLVFLVEARPTGPSSLPAGLPVEVDWR